MTDDEYLVTRGWETDGLDDGGEALWTHPRRPKGHGGGRRMHFTTAEAVETQIAEDRACLAFVQNHSPVHDDSGVPYDSLTVDAAQPDARLVPASGLLRTAEGRTVRFNPAGWRSVRLEADGSTT